MKENYRPSWVKDKNVAEDFEVIHCKKTDLYKDLKTDKGCYILIRVYMDTLEIGVAVCNYENVILIEFRGTKAQDIYNEIFKYEREHKLEWFNEPEHIAYLGKELKKAELSLVLGSPYYQE